MPSILFIGFVVLIIYIIKLGGRVSKLEQALKVSFVRTVEPVQMQSQPSVVSGDLIDYISKQTKLGVDNEQIKSTLLGNGWAISDVEAGFGAVAMTAVSPQNTQDVSVNSFFAWFKEDWLLKFGAFLLLIGFGWLTTYAFMNNWIGPMGRITLGIVAGAIFIMLGWWRIKSYIHQGGIFLALGSTTILLTVFAARGVYGFFNPASALAVMFLSTALVALASVKFKSRSLSVVSLILAGLAPLLTASPSPDYIYLFAYLFVVVLGTIWVVTLTGQRALTGLALTIIFLYSLPVMSLYPFPDRILLLFAYAFAVVFFITNTIGILKLKGRQLLPDLVTAAANGIFLILWIMSAVSDEYQSLVLSVWMVIFAVGAFMIFKATERKEPFYVYAGVGIIMLAVATAAELNGSMLVLAYAFEVATITIVGYLLLQNIKIAQKLSMLLIIPVIMSFESMSAWSWGRGVIHKDFFVLLIVGAIAFGLGLFLSRQSRGEVGHVKKYNNALMVIGSVYMYILLWLSLHSALSNNDVAIMVSLLVYTLIGLVMYFYGLSIGNNGYRTYGGVLLGFVIGRLLIVDVWRMEISVRIIIFFVIGALLVSTAFLGKRHKNETKLIQ